jgi:TetR/AcrR family transcriptional regulator, transcriptional repressor for nem operon
MYDVHHINAMRYSRDHKKQTHTRLVKKAAEQFRRRGVQGIGIAKLMSQLGLTHGGFYAHFRNKDELISAATRQMFEEAAARMEAAAEKVPEGGKVAAIVNYYLSAGHRDSVTQGCMLPALAGEMSRQPGAVRKAYTQGLSAYAARISKYMRGAGEEDRRNQARLLFAGMAGSMMLARSVDDPAMSDEILRQAREFYSSAFQSRETAAGG